MLYDILCIFDIKAIRVPRSLHNFQRRKMEPLQTMQPNRFNLLKGRKSASRFLFSDLCFFSVFSFSFLRRRCHGMNNKAKKIRMTKGLRWHLLPAFCLENPTPNFFINVFFAKCCLLFAKKAYEKLLNNENWCEKIFSETKMDATFSRKRTLMQKFSQKRKFSRKRSFLIKTNFDKNFFTIPWRIFLRTLVCRGVPVRRLNMFQSMFTRPTVNTLYAKEYLDWICPKACLLGKR
jgi:hypothetical protein